ncbi:MAG TPA: hypothetical protein VH370_11110 [Humisphaera sp.]|jgi:hypothetical protein|nr:hypothetical protein [Humisphaera sp.]
MIASAASTVTISTSTSLRVSRLQFRKPSQILLLKARQELDACRVYVDKYFDGPVTPVSIDAKAVAVKAMRRLALAIRRKNARQIEEAADLMAGVMVYLWAVKQFRDKDRKP